MKTSPYSLDLREKVIQFLESGNTQVSAAQLFSLHLSTVNRWYSRYREEGHYAPRKRPGAKSKIDKEALIRCITANPNLTLKGLAKEFGVSLWGIYYCLKKLGFSYKKKSFPMWSRVKNREPIIKKK